MQTANGNSVGKYLSLIQPIKDLAASWDIDISSYLAEYLNDLETIYLTVEEGLNFAEAALLIQGSASVYCRKVDNLCSLVNQILDIMSDQGQRSHKDLPLQADQLSKDPNRQSHTKNASIHGYSDEDPTYLILNDDIKSDSKRVQIGAPPVGDRKNQSWGSDILSLSSKSCHSLSSTSLNISLALNLLQHDYISRRGLRLSDECGSVLASGALVLEGICPAPSLPPLTPAHHNQENPTTNCCADRWQGDHEYPCGSPGEDEAGLGAMKTGSPFPTASNDNYNSPSHFPEKMDTTDRVEPIVSASTPNPTPLLAHPRMSIGESPPGKSAVNFVGLKRTETVSASAPLLDPHEPSTDSRPLRLLPALRTNSRRTTSHRVVSSKASSVRCDLLADLCLRPVRELLDPTPFHPILRHKHPSLPTEKDSIHELEPTGTAVHAHTQWGCGRLGSADNFLCFEGQPVQDGVGDGYDSDDSDELYSSPPEPQAYEAAPQEEFLPEAGDGSVVQAGAFESACELAETLGDHGGLSGKVGEEMTYESLCRYYVDRFVSDANRMVQESALSRRVAKWTERLEGRLARQEALPAFDMHRYCGVFLRKLSHVAQTGGAVAKSASFLTVLQTPLDSEGGKDRDCSIRSIVVEMPPVVQEDVCRYFLACLQLANDDNLLIEKLETPKETPRPSSRVLQLDELKIRLLDPTHKDRTSDFRAPSVLARPR